MKALPLLMLALACAAPLRAAGADDAWRQEMERKLDLLTRELEASRLSASEPAQERPALPVAPYSFGPGAAEVYGARALSIGGYGEMIYQGPERGSPRLNLARGVLYTGYRFADKILFDSELEVEGANSSKSGEVGVEFAFLDFALSKPFGLRVGKLLMPVGLTNEYHEPVVFNGALRPDSERFIIPTTWAENGLGWYGEAGPWAYRGCLVAGLRAAADASANQEGMQAAIGLKESRQEGSNSLARGPAYAQRLDYVGIPGLLFGASGFVGNAGQGDRAPSGRTLSAPVFLWEAHARAERGGWSLKALYVQASIGGAGAVNEANGLTGAGSVGSLLRGGYLEAGYDLMGRLAPAGGQSLEPFLRWERYDTQARVPAGYLRDPASNRTVWTLGFTYKPIFRVALKADYQIRGNQAGSGNNQLNLASGYEF